MCIRDSNNTACRKSNLHTGLCIFICCEILLIHYLRSVSYTHLDVYKRQVYDQDGLPVSHKANKGRHGFGIKSIKKVVKQYNGNLQMYYDNDSGTFHTIITLKQ